MFTCNQEKVLIDVKNVVSPSEFVACIGEVEDFVNFKQFMFRMNEWCSNQKRVPSELGMKKLLEDAKIHLSPKVLVKLAVKSPPKEAASWHRGQICSIESLSQINVHLIDHGVVKEISLDKSSDSIIFQLPIFFNELAPQAKLCAINLANPTSGFWSLKSIEFFNELLVDNDTIQVKIASVESTNDVRFDNKKYILDVFDGESSLLDKLVQNGYAMNPSLATQFDKPSAAPTSGGFNLHDQYMKFNKRSDAELKKMTMSNDIIDLTQEEIIDISDEDKHGFRPVCRMPNKSSITIARGEGNMGSQSKGPFKPNRPLQSQVELGGANPDSDPSIIKISARSTGLKSKLIRKINQNMQYLEESDGLDQTCANQGIDLSYFGPNDPDSSPKSPVDALPRRTFICSDETILTGYKTNTDINAAELAESIKFANLNRIYSNVHHHFPALANKTSIVATDEHFDKEQKIYDIISGDDTLKPLSFKAKLLVNMYHRDKSDAKLIVRCILKEIINQGVDPKFAMTLLNELKFCTKELFIGEIDRMVKESDSLVHDPTLILHASSNRKNICMLLSRLYACSCTQKDNRNLSAFKEYFENLMSEWTSIRPEIENQPSYIYAQNFQNLQELLKSTLATLKRYDLRLLEMIHKNAAKYALDATLKNEVRTECIKTNIMIASQYVNYQLESDAESSAMESDTNDDGTRSAIKACEASPPRILSLSFSFI